MMLRKHGAILLALWVGLYAYACNPNESETHTATLGGKADQAGLPSEGMNWAEIEKRCQRPAEDEPIILTLFYFLDPLNQNPTQLDESTAARLQTGSQRTDHQLRWTPEYKVFNSLAQEPTVLIQFKASCLARS